MSPDIIWGLVVKYKAQLIPYVLGLITAFAMTYGGMSYSYKRDMETLRESYDLSLEKVRMEHEESLRVATEKSSKTISEMASKNQELTSRLDKTVAENTSLKQKVKQTTLRVVKPDGTIVDKSVTESDTESVTSIVTTVKQEYASKVSELEKRWVQAYKEKVDELHKSHDVVVKELEKKIETLEKTRVTEEIVIKEKRYGVGIFGTTDKAFGAQVDITVFGSVFLFGGASMDTEKHVEAHAGVGIRF